MNAGPDLDRGPVAPLLQQVAADVKRFVKSSGLNRMPTRSEMHTEGKSQIRDYDSWRRATGQSQHVWMHILMIWTGSGCVDPTRSSSGPSSISRTA